MPSPWLSQVAGSREGVLPASGDRHHPHPSPSWAQAHLHPWQGVSVLSPPGAAPPSSGWPRGYREGRQLCFAAAYVRAPAPTPCAPRRAGSPWDGPRLGRPCRGGRRGRPGAPPCPWTRRPGLCPSSLSSLGSTFPVSARRAADSRQPARRGSTAAAGPRRRGCVSTSNRCAPGAPPA